MYLKADFLWVGGALWVCALLAVFVDLGDLVAGSVCEVEAICLLGMFGGVGWMFQKCGLAGLSCSVESASCCEVGDSAGSALCWVWPIGVCGWCFAGFSRCGCQCGCCQARVARFIQGFFGGLCVVFGKFELCHVGERGAADWCFAGFRCCSCRARVDRLIQGFFGGFCVIFGKLELCHVGECGAAAGCFWR